MDVGGSPVLVTRLEDPAAEDGFVEVCRPVDVGDRQEVRDGESVARRHFIAGLLGILMMTVALGLLKLIELLK